MHVFNLPDYIGYDVVSENKLIIANKYVSKGLSQLALFSTEYSVLYKYTEYGKYAIGLDHALYLWCESLNDYQKTEVEIPEGFIFYGVYGDKLFFVHSVEKKICLINHDSGKLELEVNIAGSYLYFDGSQYVVRYPRNKGLECFDLTGKSLWKVNAPFKTKVCKEKGVGYYSEKSILKAIDLTTGELVFQQEGMSRLVSINLVNNTEYLIGEDVLWVYCYESNQIIKKISLPIEKNYCFYNDYFFLADRYSSIIHCYDKKSLGLVKSQIIPSGLNLSGGGFLIYEDLAILNLSSNDTLNQVGKSFVALFSLDEFFSDNFQQEVEPDYFQVYEEADIEGGNNLRITLDASINFDTLYRHLSVALQNIPFRHGNYGWAATLDEEKPVNENFNGKVIADLSDHVFTPEQRDLLEEVIQEAMEFYANRQITSGDGKGTPCYVVSVIPVAE